MWDNFLYNQSTEILWDGPLYKDDGCFQIADYVMFQSPGEIEYIWVYRKSLIRKGAGGFKWSLVKPVTK